MLILGTMLSILLHPEVQAQTTYIAAKDESFLADWAIQAGLFGAGGGSKLTLADEYLPPYSGSEFYKFDLDLFIMLGAKVKVRTPFLGRSLSIVSEPAFTKYSYGSHDFFDAGDHRSIIDIDLETIRIPIGFHYNLGSYGDKLSPYFGASYTLAVFTDLDTDLRSFYVSGENLEREPTHSLSNSRYQNSILATIGAEYTWTITTLFCDVAFELGDGILDDKYKEHFLRSSRTFSIYLRAGALF